MGLREPVAGPSSAAAAHPVVGKASDSGFERMATQSISTKFKVYRVPQDVRCITTPILARETLRSPVASLWQNMQNLTTSFVSRYFTRRIFFLSTFQFYLIAGYVSKMHSAIISPMSSAISDVPSGSPVIRLWDGSAS